MMTFKYEKAIYDCKVAIENDKKYVSAYIRLANCYFQLNKPSNAEKFLEKGICCCSDNCKLQEKVSFSILY